MVSPHDLDSSACPRAMHRSKTTQEVKLRAACDRCHDLKNRCVRTGGPESRCNRCERLDIDCVYRNNSRVGRPKAQRRTSGVSQPQLGCEHSYQVESRDSNLNGEQDLSERPLDTSGWTADMNQAQVEAETETEGSGNTAFNESPSDLVSLLISSEVVQQTEMDWSHIDFSRHIDAIDESGYHGAPRPSLAAEPFYFQDSGVVSNTDSGGISNADSVGVSNTEKTTDRLLQLQGQLHRLLSTTDRRPVVDYVGEGLEVTKSFLEILQASMVSHGLHTNSSITSITTALRARGNSNGNGVEITRNFLDGERSSSTDSASRSKVPAAAGVNLITVQQALICYSCILPMLDRIVGVLTTNDNQVDGTALEPPVALSIGFFSLASQPALNAGIVLHLMLRMVQHLRVLVQQLAAGCKDLTDRSSSPADSVVDIGGSPGNVYTSSVAVTTRTVADLISDREKSLVERLLCLTRGP